MIQSYDQAVEYLYKNLPMFQRVGAVAYKADLTNTVALCEALGNPQNKFRSIHVAGTNGKGSTSHWLASILQEAGYKTGLYTSPHLKSFTERIRINGVEIEEQYVVDFVNRIHDDVQRIQPSFFEITVAMAFDYFVMHGVDVAVVEVGLGGRLDSTNVIRPELSVITNIGWDHKDLLGDSLEKIAFEKAGIIKDNIPVVVSLRQEDLQHVFIEKARRQHANIFFASDEYKVKGDGAVWRIEKEDVLIFQSSNIPLRGLYQKQNLPGVMKACDLLNKSGFILSNDAVQRGIEKVVLNTKLKGRWQKLADRPMVVCDTGHNVDGIRAVVQQINTYTFKCLRMVIGMVKDKDISEVLSLLPKDAIYYFCEAKIPRALSADLLAEKASLFGLRGTIIPDVNEAKRRAMAEASADDFVFIGGSTFVVAELEEL